jgi:C-terminal processing protease CtpA/Prc
MTLVHQEDLGDTGFVTGYLLDDISTAVLSIPSFNSDLEPFSDVLNNFFANASDADAKRVIIDLQQNDGGQTSLALAAYRRV